MYSSTYYGPRKEWKQIVSVSYSILFDDICYLLITICCNSNTQCPFNRCKRYKNCVILHPNREIGRERKRTIKWTGAKALDTYVEANVRENLQVSSQFYLWIEQKPENHENRLSSSLFNLKGMKIRMLANVFANFSFMSQLFSFALHTFWSKQLIKIYLDFKIIAQYTFIVWSTRARQEMWFISNSIEYDWEFQFCSFLMHHFQSMKNDQLVDFFPFFDNYREIRMK